MLQLFKLYPIPLLTGTQLLVKPLSNSSHFHDAVVTYPFSNFTHMSLLLVFVLFCSFCFAFGFFGHMSKWFTNFAYCLKNAALNFSVILLRLYILCIY